MNAIQQNSPKVRRAGSNTARILAAVAVMSLAGSICRADLPGMAGGNGEATTRPDAPQPPPVAPAMPLRGNLFRAGATAIATAPGEDAGPNAVRPSASFTAVTPAQPKKYKKNDIVTVVINEQSNSTSGGKSDAKKTQDFDFQIQQLLQLALSSSGLPTVGAVGAPAKLPEVKFSYDDDRQADSEQDRTDQFSARITATVVDVKPNGTLAIEAVKQITVDKEVQTFKLTGMCRVEDLAPDNTILSSQLANLNLSKQTSGIVHDNGKRGWLNGLLDKFNPF